MTRSSKVIRSLLAYLEGERDAGVQTVELSEESVSRLKEAAAPPPVPRATRAPSSSHSARPAPFPASEPPGTPALKISSQSLDDIARQISTCTACDLSRSRTHTVPGEGNGNGPDLLFVGEGPGAEEDAQGQPFVGKAGELLTKMIESGMGYRRDEVFIANVVKCRPPGNRVPHPKEVQTCLPFLFAQIALIRPKIIIALGKTAVEGLLGEPVAITHLRGQWQEVQGIPMMPTYHPAYLLRSPSRKGEAWADLKAVLARLGKEPPRRQVGQGSEAVP